MSSAVNEMPRCRTATRSVPSPGESTGNVIGSAVLTGTQRSVRIARGGATGALQAYSMTAASNAQAARGGRVKHALVNAAILSLIPSCRGKKRHPLLPHNRGPGQGLRYERCGFGQEVCGYGMLDGLSFESSEEGMVMAHEDIKSVLLEERSFPPSDEFAARVRLTRSRADALYRKAGANYLGFWADLARRELVWQTPFTQTFDDSSAPNFRWFADGRLNVSYNCLDVHLAERGHQTALIFEGEPGDTRRLSYRELHAAVCRCANALKAHGVGLGDRVVIYMPLVPEVVIAMQACARIGAVHSVIFGGFAANAIAQGSHRGCGREASHHRRRGAARREHHRAESRRRPGARGRLPDDRARHRVSAHG